MSNSAVLNGGASLFLTTFILVLLPTLSEPSLIVSTLLTHLCGGSAGREGAALQVGGALGNTFAKLFQSY